MTDPEQIIRRVAENPPKVTLTPLQKVGRVVYWLLALVGLVLALVVLVEQNTAAGCAVSDAQAQYRFTQAIEKLFLPHDATPAERAATARRFRHALDRYAQSAADYQNCVR